MRMLQRFVLQSAESHALSMLLGICACFFLPFQYMAVYMYIYTHREIQYTTVRTRVELQMPTLMPRTLKPKAQNPKPSILAQVLRAGPRARGCEQSCWAAECCPSHACGVQHRRGLASVWRQTASRARRGETCSSRLKLMCRRNGRSRRSSNAMLLTAPARSSCVLSHIRT